MPTQLNQTLLSIALLVAVGCPNDEPNDSGPADGAVDADVLLDTGPDAEAERLPGMIGDSCESDEDCIVESIEGTVACLRQSWGFSGGYCAILGARDEAMCRSVDPLSTHVPMACAESTCLAHCEVASDCRSGYECFQGLGACWPRCEPGRACPVPPPKLCELDEDCDDGDECNIDGCVDGICDYQRATGRPRRVAQIATQGTAVDVDFYGSIEDSSLRLHVAEQRAGAEVFDLSNPTEPAIFFRLDTTGDALAIHRDGGQIFVAEGMNGVEMFNANGGLAYTLLLDDGDGDARGVGPFVNGQILISGFQHGLYRYVYGEYRLREPCDTRGRAMDGVWIPEQSVIHIADALAGLATCSYEDGTQNNTQIETSETNGRMLALSREGEALATAEAGDGFGIFDISTWRPSRRHVSGPLDGDVSDVLLMGRSTLAVAASEGGLYMFALEDCFQPEIWYRWETDGPALAIDETEGVLAIALGDGGVELLDLGCRQLED